MSSSRCFMLALLVVLTVPTLSACGSPSTSPSPAPSLTSGVQGKVMFSGGPVLSTETPSDGTPPKIQQGPMPGVAVAVHEGDLGGGIVVTVKADASARFKVELPPGTYTLVAKVPGARPETVTVEPGKYVKATLWDNVP